MCERKKKKSPAKSSFGTRLPSFLPSLIPPLPLHRVLEIPYIAILPSRDLPGRTELYGSVIFFVVNKTNLPDKRSPPLAFHSSLDMADLHTSSTSSSSTTVSDTSSSEQEVAIDKSHRRKKQSALYVLSHPPSPFCLPLYLCTDHLNTSYLASDAKWQRGDE